MTLISSHPLSLSFLSFFFWFLLSLISKMEEKDKETRVSRNAALKLPPALRRPAGETVRIQNTDPRPKPRNAPLSPLS